VPEQRGYLRVGDHGLGGERRPREGHGELAGARTQDPRLKRALLYQLSYELTLLVSRLVLTTYSNIPTLAKDSILGQGTILGTILYRNGS
jgi:hypothetical protein